jgi:carboxylate-amine ligase
MADAYARASGARAVALATSPSPTAPHPAPDARVQALRAQFGLTAEESLTSSCHVHVSVDSEEEGVAVLDRIRIWLPVLAALSSNSPFWQGRDTGYAGYRTQAWLRWPGTGPSEIFGSAAAYHRSLRQALDSGVVLDHAMLYLDARLSHKHPTVEIRVADVCLQASDTVLIAGLSRALVETAAREWRSGLPPAPVPASVLRLSAWQASRWGIAGNLLHPFTGVPCPAGAVISLLFEHTRQALADAGDESSTKLLYQQLQARGTGSRLQREAFEREGLVGLATTAAYFTHLTRPQPATADDNLMSGAPGHP